MAQPLPERQFVPFLLLGSVISLCVLVTHWPALDARALAFDDGEYLVSNRLVQNPSLSSAERFLTEVTRPSTVRGYYQPLTMISLMLDSALGGSPENLRPYHRTSLALHTANTLLVLLLLYLLFGHWPAAALVALLFGVHPLTVEPIPWVGERKTLLAAFFSLISLACYALQVRREAKAAGIAARPQGDADGHGAHGNAKHHAEDGHKHPHAHTLAAARKAEAAARLSWKAWLLYGGCIIGYLCAVLSKPTATPLPVVMLLLDFWPLRRLNARAVLEKTPLMAVGMLSAIVTYISQDRSASTFDPGQLSAFRGLFNVCHNLVFYPAKMLWPANLSPHYPFPQPFDLTNLHVLFGVIGTLLLAALAILSLRRGRAFFTGAMIFFFALLPTTGIVGFTNVVASDKYVYLPAVGVLIVLAWLAQRLWERPAGKALPVRTVLVGTTAAAALALACVSRGDLTHWRDTQTIYGHALALAPTSYILHHNYALSLQAQGRMKEALTEYDRAIELNPTYCDTWFNLGIALDQAGQKEEAIKAFRQAVQLNPHDAKTLNNLGNVLFALGRHVEALAEYQHAVESDPTLVPAQTNLANSLLQAGRVDEAIPHYRQAIARDAACAGAHHNLGIALFRKGAVDEAIQEYEVALRLRPNAASCEHNLGIALAKKGRLEESIQHYQAALRIQPRYANALTHLGAALSTLGRTTEATEAFSQALQLNPEDKEARSGLALLMQARNAPPTLAGTALSTRPE